MKVDINLIVLYCNCIVLNIILTGVANAAITRRLYRLSLSRYEYMTQATHNIMHTGICTSNKRCDIFSM